MPRVEISLPEELYTEIVRVADEDFVNEDTALEELLTTGVEVYATEFESDREADVAEEYAEELWDTAEDPALDDDSGSETRRF